MRKLVILSLLILFNLSVLAQQDQKHPFSFYDMIKMKRLSQLTASPDGQYLAVVVTTYNLQKNSSTKDIYLFDFKNNMIANITNGDGKNFNPVFSPDSKKLYFIKARGADVNIFEFDLNSQTTKRITNLTLPVSNLKISPTGDFFVFSLPVFPELSDPKKVKSLMRKRQSGAVYMMYDELPIRHWDTWEDSTWNHLFLMYTNKAIPKKSPFTFYQDAVADLMFGIKGNCPSKPWGGTDEFDISPDGRYLAYTTKLGRDRMWTTNFDVYLLDLKTGERKNITKDNPAWDKVAFFSPDGKYLYYLAMKIPKYESDRFRIMRYELATGKVENLTEDFQVSPRELVISNDGKTIYFTGDKEGRIRIFALNTETKEIKEIVSQHTNKAINLVGNKLYFLQESFTSPAEIYMLDLQTGEQKKISHFNDEILAKVKFGEVEEFWFTNRDGIKVHGWLLKPVDFDPNKKYPLAFYVHGGPQGAWHDGFHYRWNLQLAPSHGYVAVAINFRGSTGYGDNFRLSITQHWGDRPFNDLMDGLAYVLKQYPFIDENRKGVLGASYGGYMVNYMMGKAADVFDAFISHAGLFDLISMYYETEELWFPEFEFGGTPWQNHDLYVKFSPSTYVTKWKKPILIIHGGKDFRVPETQGFSAFTAAQRLGIPSKLLYFPNESHFVLQPKNSELWHKEVFNWLDKWVKNKK